MNICCLAALLLALIKATSVPVMKPLYRRITPDMANKRIRKLNQKSEIMFKINLILSRTQLI